MSSLVFGTGLAIGRAGGMEPRLGRYMYLSVFGTVSNDQEPHVSDKRPMCVPILYSVWNNSVYLHMEISY